jgi:small subunit ribosomal protein S20
MAQVNRSAKKRVRQDERRKMLNRSYKSFVKTLTKKFELEEDPAKKAELKKQLDSALDRAVSKNLMHENKAARRKGKSARAIAKSQSESPQE